MEDDDRYKELEDWLRERGHTGEEVQKIVARVRHYDDATRHDSVMDSIAAGTFNLNAIIKEALGDTGTSQSD